MRIECCPRRSPLRASSRLPGGCRRSSSFPAPSSSNNFRRACLSIARKRGTSLFSNRRAVAAFRNERIIREGYSLVGNSARWECLPRVTDALRMDFFSKKSSPHHSAYPTLHSVSTGFTASSLASDDDSFLSPSRPAWRLASSGMPGEKRRVMPQPPGGLASFPLRSAT